MRATDLTPMQVMFFWTQVQRAEGGCWLWTGRLMPSGYGDFQTTGKHWRVHRLAYELLVGPVPDGLVLDHLCRVRSCVRPSHLEPVTTRENILRGAGVTAANARLEECRRGHAFTPENTYMTSWGARQCRACHRLRRRRNRAAREATHAAA